MIHGGYYIKARCIAGKKIAHASPHIREVWDYLLREANHKDNFYQGHLVKRGQLFRSYSAIREALHWCVGWRKEMYSENQMKLSMRYLRKHLMITTTKTLGGVLISVINYDTYQDSSNYENTKENHTENTSTKPTRAPSSSDNNKNVKELKNKRIKNKETISGYSEEFENWWKIYPSRNGRKIGKGKAAGLFVKLSTKHLKNLITGTEIYSKECNGYPKDAHRFLRDKLWLDYSIPVGNNSLNGGISKKEVYKTLNSALDKYADHDSAMLEIKKTDKKLYRIAKDYIGIHTNRENTFSRIFSVYQGGEA